MCVCPHVPELPALAAAARVSFVVHVKEWKRLSNTARLFDLVMTRNGAACDVYKHGMLGTPLTLDELEDDGRTFVLFPGQRSRVLSDADIAQIGEHGTPRIVVPDGTWGQANQIMKRVQALGRLPVFSLPRPPVDASRMRRNAFGDRMSTFEAVAQAMGLFAGQVVEDALNDFLRRTADRMMLMRGRLKATEVHGGLRSLI